MDLASFGQGAFVVLRGGANATEDAFEQGGDFIVFHVVSITYDMECVKG